MQPPPLPSEEIVFHIIKRISPESQHHDLALTVLFVPYSPGSETLLRYKKFVGRCRCLGDPRSLDHQGGLHLPRIGNPDQ